MLVSLADNSLCSTEEAPHDSNAQKWLAVVGGNAQDDTCYLLSENMLHGARNSLTCLGLDPLPGTSLPAYPLWGFVHPSCWSYVRQRRRLPHIW